MAYFANGSEGEQLDRQCAECKLPDDAPCPVLLTQLTYNYKQIGNDDLSEAVNLLINSEGICQMKPLLDELPSES